MTYLRRSIVAVCVLAVLSCVIACGGMKQAMQDALDMLSLGQSYSAFASDHNNKGPANADEWEKWATEKSRGDAEIALIKQCKAGGKYTFYWGVELDKLQAGKSNTVIGYETKVPESGGNVVMADGSTQKTMTADEFKNATKAK